MLYKKLLILFFTLGSIIVNAQNYNLPYASTGNNQSYLVFNQDQNHFKSSFSALEFNKSLKLKNDKHPLEKTGKILTFIGIPLTIIGGIMVAGADELYYECTNGQCSGDPRGGFGVVLLGMGVGMSGTGIVLWTIGKNKS